MSLLLLAGCCTSRWADLGAASVSRGVDSVITFSGLVYYPATAPGVPADNGEGSGNYFWSRFSAHSSEGGTLLTALALARTELVAREGHSGGWHRYVIRGASTGAHDALPFGPTVTRPFAGFHELTPVSVASSPAPAASRPVEESTGLTEVATAEGVVYRVRPDGSVLDAVGTPSTAGPVRLSAEGARLAARRFAEAQVPGFGSGADDGWLLTADEPAGHLDGDALRLLCWRPLWSGVPGAREVSVEIDLRSGAVVYFADVRGTAAEAAAGPGGFPVSAAQATVAARRLAGDLTAPATAEADIWHTGRWTVTLDRGNWGGGGDDRRRPGPRQDQHQHRDQDRSKDEYQGTGAGPELRFPRIERIEVDAHTGAVLSRTST
ncbi:hypothetical protein [Streptomyces aidingensis]|uniref:Uncharacterized protein n=1 Tax=Streptomyces aidingensis TaxID=910347 RepID=A0A1I1HLQ9_9ACTN|nr:hypothetical protein [Streptomyces aidingensis]SFC22383.1 hypothetical protein SAMN05421773_102358 [Streptomyces aidingensis]